MIDVTGVQSIGKLAQRPLPPMPMAAGLSELTGAVKFYIGVNITEREMSEWSARRIANFFNGVAQVIAARGAPYENQAS